MDQSALLAGSKKLSQCQSWQREIGGQLGALWTPVLSDSVLRPRYTAAARGRPPFAARDGPRDPIEQFNGKRSAQRADSTDKKVRGHMIGGEEPIANPGATDSWDWSSDRPAQVG